ADLRRQLAASEAECHVVKNRLALLAARHVGREGMASMLKGPTAMVFGYGDITEPAKVLIAYARASQRLQIKAGLLDARLLTSDEVASVARLPARDVLLAQLVGELQLPLRQLVGVLSNLPGALVRVLQARKQQLEAA
ncbi:MAG: 50S ribosomal protein L10, partial [Chloroflexi bacterium]|nr:50S ribosomal protein L10 [Chloroflexota bacterium]